MTSTTRSSRRGAFATALAAVLCAAPAVLAAQPSTTQPPAGTAGQPPMGGGPGMGGRRGGGMQMLLEGITLTDAQRAKVDSMQTANRARMEAMRGQMQGPPDSAARAQRRQEMEAQRTAMRAMLTPDQQKTFDANVARMQQMQQQRMREGGAPGGAPAGTAPGRG